METMAGNGLFQVSAQIGGYVVSKPDPSVDGYPTRGFVCTSKEQVHAHLEQWIVWAERDEQSIAEVEEGMRAGK